MFDTHAHYDDKRFSQDLDEVLDKVFKSGVKYILNAASDPDSLESTLNLANKYKNIFASVGVHPHSASLMNDKLLERVRELANSSKVVAIGEIGLDYHYDFSPRDVQIKWFISQIELAKTLNLPVIIHNRESTEDMLHIIKQTSVKIVGGIFHCFSGSLEMAKILLDNNFYLSFGGPVTFKNAQKTLEIIKYIPLERILLETDSPYLTPEPHRGKRNDSSFLIYIAKRIATIKEIDLDVVINTTTANALRVFGIKDKNN